MRSSSLFSRKSTAFGLSFLSTVCAQSIPGASLFVGGGAPGAASYQLVDDYEGPGGNFFNKFNFYSSYDPTYGHVQYVNQSVAVQNGYATTSSSGTAVISVDTTNQWPNGGPGRPAVRLISDNAYTHGLFILDLKHMPWGCGTWPAYWLLGPNWPSNGEIDIIEGVHTSTSNSISMHTSNNCTITGSGQTATFETSDCYEADNGNSGCGSSLTPTEIPNNYGGPLNSIGGGVYVTEWTSNYVQHWFFPRGSIPASITSGRPVPSQFGTPAVNAQGQCSIDQHFGNMSIIINTDFCGAWAGFVYDQFPNCPLNSSANGYDSCVDFVGLNPQNFTNAYWEINSIKVYQMPQNAQTSSTYSTSLSSVTPSASTNTLPMGQGASTSTLSSVAYTGPLSSASSSKTVSSSTSSATPFLCPGSNGTTWTDNNNQQYTIQCGFDYTAGSYSNPLYQTNSFEACLETCDSLAGCTGVAFVGGNGAGNCYPKVGTGSFRYDGSTNAATRVAGPASPSSSSMMATSSMIVSSSMPASSSSAMMSSSSMMASSSSARMSSSSPSSSSSSMVASSASLVSSSSSIIASSSTPAPSSSTIMASSSSIVASSTAPFSSTAPATSSSFYSSSAQSSTSSSSTSSSSSISMVATSNAVVPTALTSSSMASSSAQTSSSTMQSSSAAASSTPAYSSASTVFNVYSSTVSTVSNALSSTAAGVISISQGSPPAPPCPSGTGSLCGQGSSASTTCSSSAGNNYDVNCGIEYEGTVIDTSGISGKKAKQKRANEPTFQDCQTLCDSYPSCVALNYEGTNCTLLSSVTGQSYVSGAVGASQASSWPSATSSSGYPAPTENPTCPDWAGRTYTDSGGTAYAIGCYTDYAGNDISAPISESSISNCVVYCDSMSGCAGVEFNVAYSLCYLKSSFSGRQKSNTSVIYGMRNGGAPAGAPGGYGGVTNTVTPTVTPSRTTTLSLPYGATVTVVPTTTVTSLVPPGGSYTSVGSNSYYVYTTVPSESVSAGSGSGGANASLCYSCALTPTVVTGGQGGAGGSGSTGSGVPSAGGTCNPRPGVGTTTFFTTHTITSCGLLGVCPASGYIIGGGDNVTQSGAQVITTTDKSGHPVTYTQIPTGPGAGGNSGAGAGMGPGNGGGGSGGGSGSGGGGGGGAGGGTTGYGGPGTGTLASVSTTNTALPTCPPSNNVQFTSPLGRVYQSLCGQYFNDRTVDTQTQPDLGSCIAACDMYNTLSFMIPSPCLGVSFYDTLTTDNCELKAGSHAIYQNGVSSGRLVTPYLGGTSNGTGGGGDGLGGSDGTGMGTMTSAPVVTTFVTGQSTVLSTIVSGGSTYVSTLLTGGYTVVQTITGGLGGNGGGSGSGSGPGGYGGGGGVGESGGNGGSGGVGGSGGSGGSGGGGTGLGGYGGGGGSGGSGGSGGGNGGNGGAGTGPGTGPGTGYGTVAVTVQGTGQGTGPGTGPGTGYGTGVSYVPSTIYGTSTAVSTYVSNGMTQVTTYGVTTVISVVYQTATTKTVTTTTVSVSISKDITTASGPTATASAKVITITKGGSGEGGYVTVTAPPSTTTVVSYVYPSSTSSSFTCRTYATNYLNGMHGRKKKRSIFDADDGFVMGEMDRAPKPGAVPKL